MRGVEDLATQAVALVLEREDLAVVDVCRSIIAVVAMSSSKISPHAEKGLLDVTISDARS
jgi:hypothetical protein